MIYRGEKTLIVKARPYRGMIGKWMILLGDYAYGDILLGGVKEIDLEQFEKLRDRHRISDKEREEWWPGKKKLYAFEFDFNPYPVPRRYVKPKGIQTFIRNVKLKAFEATLCFLGTKGEIEEESPQHKYHSSILLLYSGLRLLFDWGKERPKAIQNIQPDAIFITHAHPDHVGGLKEEGAMVAALEIPIFLPPPAFNWAKENLNGALNLKLIKKETEINGISITPIPVLHSVKAPAYCYFVETKDFAFIYAPDTLSISKDDREKFLTKCDLYIGDGSALTKSIVRRTKEGEPIGHASFMRQLKWARDAGVPAVIFTHFGKEAIEKKELAKKVAEMGAEVNVKASVAKDGMCVDLSALAEPITKIADIDRYNPKNVNDYQLADDWRIAMAWYSRIRRGKPFKYTEEQVVRLARKIYREMKKRGFQFHPEKYKKYARELWERITHGD